MSGLIAFLIAALVIIIIAYVLIYVLDLIPGVPAPAVQIIKLLIGVIALLAILQRGLPLLGVSL